MGGALAAATAKAPETSLFICDRCREKAVALAEKTGGVCSAADEISRSCDIIFLAVKPNIIESVIKDISGALKENPDAVLVSMAAGVKLSAIEAALELGGAKIIRIMPNTPSAVGCGMTLWCNNGNVTDADKKLFLSVMAGSGICDSIPEALIDAGSAVSGCGPAFVYMFTEALADGGVLCGLPRDKALLYAAQTVKGAAEMILSGAGHPEELKDAVCSPGGSTIVGVHALEEGNFRAACENAVIKAYEKTKRLGEK